MKVSPLNLKTLAYTLDVEGFGSRPVLQRCGLPPLDALDENGEWLPVQRLDELMAAVMEATGDAGFGLVAGKSLALMRYGVLAPVILASPTLRQLLADLEQFAPLAVEQSEVVLQDDAADTRLLLRPVVSSGAGGRFRTEFVATTALQMLRFAGAQPADVREVAFTHACPAGLLERYRAAFGSGLRFGQPSCSVRFDGALLDRPLVMHDPVAYLAARARVVAALAAMKARCDLAERVRQSLLKAFPMQPTLTETARQLGMSPRTLRRQLAGLGTTHVELAQECQTLKATQLLAEGRLSIKQIAGAVGFTSVSSFHRAFRRWTDATPLQWRDDRRGAGRATALRG